MPLGKRTIRFVAPCSKRLLYIRSKIVLVCLQPTGFYAGGANQFAYSVPMNGLWTPGLSTISNSLAAA